MYSHKISSVIVIDDDEDVVKVFSEFLVLNGVDVKATASNGKDALELYQQFKPDVVVLDLVMPEYDGFYAFEQIIKEDPAAKVVILTGDTKEQDFVRLQRLRPAKIVSKPYDAYEMLDIIKDLSN